MELTQKLIIDLITDLSFSISVPIFYSSVLSMRFGKWKFIVLTAAALMIYSPVCYLIDMPQYAMFFIGILIMLASVFIFSNDKPMKKLLFTFIPYAANIVTSMIYFFFKTLFMPDFDIVFGHTDIIDAAAYLIGIILPMYAVSKLIRRKKPDVSSLTVIYILSMFVVQMVILTFIMYVYSTDMSSFVFISALMVYMIALILISLFIIRYSVRIGIEQSRRELIAGQYELLCAQYSELRSSYVSYRKLRHDLKDHIRVIQGLSRRGETDALARYADDLAESWEPLSSKTFCDVPAVDIVLADKYSIASSCGIDADFSVSGIRESGADSVYLCSIFANLLNNALEAAQRCGAGPMIELRSGIRMGNLVILCRNSMPDKPYEKKDSDSHGHGLHIISEFSELLGGSFVYENDGKIFTATVTIPVAAKEGTTDDTHRGDR